MANNHGSAFWWRKLAVLTTILMPLGAQASPIPLGFISWDVNVPGNFGQFDIINMTGPNSSPPDFPVINTALFDQSSLSLSVHFSDGTTRAFGSSYFTLDADGESLDGSAIAIGGANPLPDRATLTGSLLTTILDDPTATSVNAAFDSAIITDSPNLVNLDFAIINAEPAGPSTAVPEPDMTLTMLMGGLMIILLGGWKRRPRTSPRHLATIALHGALTFGVMNFLMSGNAAADTSVKQNTLTSPQSGVAGVSNVSITASGVPSFSPGNVTVRLAPTCTVGDAGPVAGEVDATVSSTRLILGSIDRFNFSLPAALAQGTYFAQLTDTTDGFEGGNCSIVMVTKTTAALNACVPTSSLGVVTGTSVVAYVPNGRWGVTNTGITAVPVEGPMVGTNTPISTLHAVNSCAGNPATGQVVCTANTNDVYLISGSPPSLNTTLTSNLSGLASFSGGSCTNCGVAVNALSNTAAIQGGLTGSPSGHGVTILDLNTNTFNPPFGTRQHVSEDISIDPGRGLILSPNENNNYMLLQQNSSGAITAEFDRPISSGGEPDSAGEDCATGIALAAVEFTNNVYAADLTQGTFTPGSPGSWTSPQSLFSLTGVPGFSAGISGISVAQGSSHIAFITGEFGGNTAGVLQLQPASGTGGTPPNLVDWVAFTMPPPPGTSSFTAGCDPHTMTAYTSPNTGKAIGLYTSYNTVSCANPTWIGVIDLAAALGATRNSGTHTIASSVDLIATGIVQYVRIQ